MSKNEEEYDPVTAGDALAFLHSELEAAVEDSPTTVGQIRNVLTEIHKHVNKDASQAEIYNQSINTVDAMLAGEIEGNIDEETLSSILNYLEKASTTLTE